MDADIPSREDVVDAVRRMDQERDVVPPEAFYFDESEQIESHHPFHHFDSWTRLLEVADANMEHWPLYEMSVEEYFEEIDALYDAKGRYPTPPEQQANGIPQGFEYYYFHTPERTRQAFAVWADRAEIRTKADETADQQADPTRFQEAAESFVESADAFVEARDHDPEFAENVQSEKGGLETAVAELRELVDEDGQGDEVDEN